MPDVTIRLGILTLMDITDDIGAARFFAERTAVMYGGHMEEWGESDSVTQTQRPP